LISGYQGSSTDDTLDKIIRLQALLSVGNLIGRTSIGVVWRVLVAPIWLGAGLVAVAEGRDLVGGIALLLAAWALPMALANLRVARQKD
jgi:hypothetical protein